MYGELVRTVRERRGLSQRALAETSGIPQPNISAIEAGRRIPSVDTLNRLLVACGFELAAVAGRDQVHCGLPRVGWFPDEDLPPPAQGDPDDESPVVGPETTADERVRVIAAVLDLAEAQVRAR